MEENNNLEFLKEIICNTKNLSKLYYSSKEINFELEANPRSPKGSILGDKNLKEIEKIEAGSSLEYLYTSSAGVFRYKTGSILKKGDKLSSKQVIGSLEVMKMEYELSFGHTGEFIEYLVEDGELCEYNQKVACMMVKSK